MPYLTGHWNNYGGSCVNNSSIWFPGGGGDSNDYYRNQVTNAYYNLFGRYGEQGGVEGYVYNWLYQGGKEKYSSIQDMVMKAGAPSGELNNVAILGSHTGMASGYCPPPLVYGCLDSDAYNYNPNADVNSNCLYYLPGASLSVNPAEIVKGETATLTWSTTNSYYRVIDNSIGSVGISGSTKITPQTSRTYTLTVTGKGGVSNSPAYIKVYIPPIVTLSLDDETIVLGQSTVLRWSTTGDADKNTVSPGIGSSNLTSSQVVSPTVTTEYTASVSGKGGVDSDEITLTVLQPPEVNLTTPLNVSYGNSLQLGYTAINAITSLKIVPYYYSLDGVETIGDDIVLSTDDTEESISVTHTPAWDDRGPIRIEYKLLAEGFLLPDASGIPDENSALTSEDVEIVPVLIDRKPESIVVPESNDLIKDQAPVISPNIDLTTEKLLITSIDIPVEIKSDSPIQVQIDNDGIWIDVENI